MASKEGARAKIGGWPLAAAVAVVVVFLFFVRDVLLPFVAAAALAFILAPVVDFLQRRWSLPRWAAGTAIYLFVLLALGLFVYFAAAPLTRDVTSLVAALPHNIETLIARFSGPEQKLFGRPINAAAITGTMMQETGALLRSGVLLSFASYGFAAVAGVILSLVLLCYFLVSGNNVAHGVFWLVPPEYRSEVDSLRRKILPLLRRYFAGLVIIVIYASCVAWIGFEFVFHVPRALLMAVVVGLLELIPVVGPATSITLVVLTAIQQSSLLAVIGLVGFAAALRISIDQLLAPIVLGKASRLHPVVVIFSFLTGAVLFGLLGLVLAVPVAASIKIVLTTYYAEPIAER